MLKAVLTIMIIAVAASSQEDTRQIWDTYFGNSRARSQSQAAKSSRPNTSSGLQSRPQYRRVNTQPEPRSPSTKTGVARQALGAALGITIWKMQVPAAGDDVRLLVQESVTGPTAQFTPHRLEAGEVLRQGDRVRLSIETPAGGYLYVVDQEIYDHGTFGPPYLIFPVAETHGGDNRVRAGQLIEIPGRADKVNVFTIRTESPSEQGEKLTVLLAPAPISGFTLSREAQQLSKAVFDSWLTNFQSSYDHFELADGKGRAWSKAEEEAGADAKRLLTLEDPAPQTVFVFTGRVGKTLLVTVLLNVAP